MAATFPLAMPANRAPWGGLDDAPTPDQGGSPPQESRVAIFSPDPRLLITVEAESNGRSDLHIHAGGQGVWVARMVTILDGRAVLCAPLGGEAGEVLRLMIDREGIEVRAVMREGPSGSYVDDRRGGERDRIVEVNPYPLGRHVLDELYSTFLGAALEAGVCVLAGAPGRDVLPDDTYRRLTADLRENGVVVVADLSGDQLRAALEGGIDVLKVSHEELAALGYLSSEEPSVEEVVAAAQRLRKEGAVDVIVSRAELPSVALLGDDHVEVAAPHMQVLDPSGAGDSMTAALAVGVATGQRGVDALRTAVAAGCLNVTRHGLGTGNAATVRSLAGKIRVTPVET